jgi:hypothetical protein
MSIALIRGPVAEPITLNDAKSQLGFGPMQDSDRAAAQIVNERVRAFITAARMMCENNISRVLITQTWVVRLDSFPGQDHRYERQGYPQLDLPNPPLQSIDSLTYIDVAGTPQRLTQDPSFGTNPAGIGYYYQLERGGETQPGRVLSSFARPWPPCRMVPANVIVQYRCGFGGPITASIEAGSAALTVTGGAPMNFNLDDSPLLPGETGLPISIPGAGPSGATLDTHIASVDTTTGRATLADTASTTVSAAPGWAGQRVPAPIATAIKLLVQDYYDKGAAAAAMPAAVQSLLNPYRNFVS